MREAGSHGGPGLLSREGRRELGRATDATQLDRAQSQCLNCGGAFGDEAGEGGGRKGGKEEGMEEQRGGGRKKGRKRGREGGREMNYKAQEVRRDDNDGRVYTLHRKSYIEASIHLCNRHAHPVAVTHSPMRSMAFFLSML